MASDMFLPSLPEMGIYSPLPYQYTMGGGDGKEEEGPATGKKKEPLLEEVPL